MSMVKRPPLYGTTRGKAFFSCWPRIAAGGLLLIGMLLGTSCGFVTKSEAGQSSSHDTLTLSGTFSQGTTNQAYNTVLAVSGGSAPYQFALTSGHLPVGMTLNPVTGSISGTPTTAGAYTFEVAVTDSPLPHHGSQSFSISVSGQGTNNSVRVTISPVSVNVLSGQAQTFTAAVTGTDNTAVTWTASAGSINTSGSFTAPLVSSVTTVSITATSKADSKAQAVASISVEPANTQTLSISTGSLPEGRTGNSYDAGFTASGGTQPYTWTVSQGSIPQGISLSSSSGDLAGMPGSVGSYSFSIKVTDAKAQSAQKNFSLSVAAGGDTDGPAELPRVSVSSSMADTPAPGATIFVNAGGDFQAALNRAQCGDTIELQAGATFAGTFDFPAKRCDNSHWVIVRTSSPDSALPPEGQRMNPCYAGVTSLPGRPAFSCSSQNVLARITLSTAGGSPVILMSGANHYRLLGLEITRPAGLRAAPTLVAVDNLGIADHIVVDRSWLHGTTHDDTQNGVSLQGMNYAAVVDSYFSDFHCTSGTGACSDSHAVGGGNGNHVDGPIKIAGNFLEAAGEAVMFGGGAATVTPTDIEIRRNHFFKPWQWMLGATNFVGGDSGKPFVVKNHLELKNAIRVLAEANLMENSWGGFTQTGHAILLTPKNQHTKSGTNVCPICQVTDVTVRYTRIAHAGGGMVFATSISGDGDGSGAPALSGSRWSVHDLVLDDISRNYVGGGALFEILNGWPKDPVNTVTVNHITGFPDPESHIIIMGNLQSNPQMFGFVFTNNLVTTGRYPVWNIGGGDTSCAYHGTPAQKVANCFATYKFTNNALIATPSAFPPSSWPTGNLFPVTVNDARFVRFDLQGGGDYTLRSNSPFKNAGTDGKDLGADILGLDAALAGIE